MANYGMFQRPTRARGMFGGGGIGGLAGGGAQGQQPAPKPQQTTGLQMGQNAGLPYYQLPDGDLSNLGSLSSPRALAGIALGLGPIYGAAHQYALNALQFAQQNQPQQQRLTMQAVQAMDPRNDAANFAYDAQQMEGQGAQGGRYAAGQMRSMGMGKAAQAGAMLQAQNQAREQQADMWAALRNPTNMAQRYGAAAQQLGFGALAGQSMTGAMSAYQALMSALMQNEGLNSNQEGLKAQMDAASGGGFLDDVLGIVGSLGGYGGVKDLFKDLK